MDSPALAIAKKALVRLGLMHRRDRGVHLSPDEVHALILATDIGQMAGEAQEELEELRDGGVGFVERPQ